LLAPRPVRRSSKPVRVVALDSDTVTVLREHRRRQLEERLRWGPAYRSGDYVFTREDGKPYAPNYVTRTFRETLARTELPRIRLHDLRHTWASLLRPLGAN
jgi:integrase